MQDLAMCLAQQRKFEEADHLYRQILSLAPTAVLSSRVSFILHVMTYLAGSLQKQNRLNHAESLYRETIDRGVQELGAGHLTTIEARQHLADFLCYQSKHEEAQLMYRECFLLEQKIFGTHNVKTLLNMSILAVCLSHTSHLVEAEELLKVAVSGLELAVGPNDQMIIMSRQDLKSIMRLRYMRHVEVAMIMVQRAYFDEGEELCRIAVAGLERVLGPNDELIMKLQQLVDMVMQLRHARHEKSETAPSSAPCRRCRHRGIAKFSTGIVNFWQWIRPTEIAGFRWKRRGKEEQRAFEMVERQETCRERNQE
jgi:hypothetical protein